MTVGSLFSGIGGLDLGLEWAGFEVKWFCEIEEYPQRVLRRHWPDVPIIPDIRDVTAESVPRVDVVTGGFPCVDISWAGKGRGIDYDLSERDGTRSGLWWEMWRVVRDLRPRYVIAENVAALAHRGLDIVLGSLAEIGYDAEWTAISAASVGAPHIRERIIIVAYPERGTAERRRGSGELHGPEGEVAPPVHQHATSGDPGEASWFGGTWGQPWPVSFRDVADATDDNGRGRERREEAGAREDEVRGRGSSGGSTDVADATDIDAQGERTRTGEPEADRGTGGREYRGGGSGANELERVAPLGSFRILVDGVQLGLDKGGLNADAEEGGSGDLLPELREAVGQEEDQRQAGGPGRNDEAGVLRPGLYGAGHGEGKAEEADTPLAGETVQEGSMRGVWKSESVAGTSQGSRCDERRPGEHPDVLRQLPHEAPLAGVEKDRRAVSQNKGGHPPLWASEDGWLVTDVPDRTARLKALGNAVVPQVGYLVGRAVMKHANTTPPFGGRKNDG